MAPRLTCLPYLTPLTTADTAYCKTSKSCIGPGVCCGDADCSGGKTCQSGTCKCPVLTKLCGASCIPVGDCCKDTDCPGGEACTGGTCKCPAGAALPLLHNELPCAAQQASLRCSARLAPDVLAGVLTIPLLCHLCSPNLQARPSVV